MVDAIQWFLETSNYLINNFGYLGIFLVGFLGTVSVVLPTPAFVIIFFAAAKFDPLLVGIIAGFGAALGELVGYLVGMGSRKITKIKKTFDVWEKRFRKYGGFAIIILFAATPLPDDVTGILCGAMKYDIKKFFLANLIGKIILHLFIAYAGYYSVNWVLNVFGLSL